MLLPNENHIPFHKLKLAIKNLNMGVSIHILNSRVSLTLIFASDIFSSWAAFSFAMAAFNSACANSWFFFKFSSASIF